MTKKSLTKHFSSLIRVLLHLFNSLCTYEHFWSYSKAQELDVKDQKFRWVTSIEEIGAECYWCAPMRLCQPLLASWRRSTPVLTTAQCLYWTKHLLSLLIPVYKSKINGCHNYNLMKSLSFWTFYFMYLECLVHVLSNTSKGHGFFWSLFYCPTLLQMFSVPTFSISFRQAKIHLCCVLTFCLKPVSLWTCLVTMLVGKTHDKAKQKSQVNGRIKYC